MKLTQFIYYSYTTAAAAGLIQIKVSGAAFMASVQLQSIQKSYDGKNNVIHGVDLEVKHGEFVVFVGPSGCGKSTLLRMIAGLESISGGDVVIDGKRVNDEPPRNRDIAMVFQDYALYPHKSLFDNMAFGLRLRKTPEAEIQRRVMDAAKLLRIDHMLDRKPAALSGGQRQRVAIGRAIVRQPKVFLFDEPLSNLDAQLRNEMRTEIKKLHQRLGATIIYVTHDQVEAMTLADRIAVLSGGHKMQYATPDEIYNRPAAQFVAGFTGSPPHEFGGLYPLRWRGGLGRGRRYSHAGRVGAACGPVQRACVWYSSRKRHLGQPRCGGRSGSAGDGGHHRAFGRRNLGDLPGRCGGVDGALRRQFQSPARHPANGVPRPCGHAPV